MKQITKKLLASMLVVGSAFSLLTACSFGNSSDNGSGNNSEQPANIELAWTEDMVSSVVVNTELDLAQYVEYTEGYSPKLTATYEKNGETLSYDTFGLTFMPTEIEDVTVTVSLKDTDKSISKVLDVTVPAPTVISVSDGIAFYNEETMLADLAQYVEFTSQTASPSVFKALFATKGEEVIDLSAVEVYTFTQLGTYTLAFEVSNAGGKVEGEMTLSVKRNLPANELNDASNWMKSWKPASDPVKDTELKAEGSDWSYKVYASTDISASSYFSNFAIVNFDEPVDLTKQYITLDLNCSAAARPLVLIDFFSNETELARPTKQQQAPLTAGTWTHYSTADVVTGTKIVAGGHSMMRIMIMQPEGGPASEDCWVAIDNVEVNDYQGYTYEQNAEGVWEKTISYTLALNNWYLSAPQSTEKKIWIGAYNNDAPQNSEGNAYGLTYYGFRIEVNGEEVGTAGMNAYAGANWFWVIEFQAGFTEEAGRPGTVIEGGDHVHIENGASFKDINGIVYKFAGLKVFSDDQNTQLVFESEDFDLWFVGGVWTTTNPNA